MPQRQAEREARAALELAPSAAAEQGTRSLMALVARELGGPVRMAALLDEQTLRIDIGETPLSVTASLGVAEYRPGEALEALIDRACIRPRSAAGTESSWRTAMRKI